MRVFSVGGCNEFGLNMTVFEADGTWIAVDCGGLFPDDSLPGIDVVHPDLTWFRENGVRFDAVLVTHGHEDHIGALPALLREFAAPVYCSRVTAAFISEKLLEQKLRGVALHEVQASVPFSTGPFRITPLSLSHSIPESLGFYLETEAGSAFVTGDFRMEASRADDQNGPEVWRRFFADRKTDLMLCDSTNARSRGKDRVEADLVDEFLDIMRQTSGTVVFVSFASNLWRFRSILQAASTMGRRVVPFGRAVQRGFDIGSRCGILGDASDVLLDSSEVSSFDAGRICIVASGSQGEAFSGATRLALGECREISVGYDDVVVFSSKTIPGNESSVNWMQEQFMRRGAMVITSTERPVHVSGHAFSDDIRAAIGIVKPRYFVPIHGDYLKRRGNIDVAVSAGVPPERCLLIDNGSQILIEDGVARVLEDLIPTGRIYLAEGVEISASAVKERQRIGRSGIVFVSLFPMSRAASTEWQVRCACRGVPWEVADVQLICERAVEEALGSRSSGKKRGKPTSTGSQNDELRLAIRRALERQKHGFRTNVVVVVHDPV
jgi:ribonuclease J